MVHCLHLKQGGREQPVPVRGTWCRRSQMIHPRVDQPTLGVTVGRAGSSHLPPRDREWDKGLIKQGDNHQAGGRWVTVRCHTSSLPPQPSGKPGEKCCFPPSSFSSPPPDTTSVSSHSRAYPGNHPDQHLPDLRSPSGGGVYPGSGYPLWLPGL